jgi:tight adherence protein B
MSPLLLTAIILVVGALLAVVFFVIAPPAPRVPLERRLQPGAEHIALVTRATDRTVAAVDVAFRGGRALFSDAELELAGVRMETPAFLLVTFAGSVVAALFGVLLGFGTVWSLVLALLFAVLGPVGAKIILRVRTGMRRARFADQLDDTLQLISGNLRAGYGLVQAIDGLARDAEPPTSDEFARVVNETRIGRDLGDALSGTASRMRSEDFMWAAQAIAVNRETGGNLAEVLQHVAGTIRERNQIRRQVKALSAEGRLSAIILIALPIAVFVAVLIIQPGYLSTFFQNPIGIAALVLAVILMIVGSIWMLLTIRVKF